MNRGVNPMLGIRSHYHHPIAVNNCQHWHQCPAAGAAAAVLGATCTDESDAEL